MKTIIAGSRGIDDPECVLEAIEKSGIEITEVVSGGARGVDRMGESYAEASNIPVKQFIPDWSKGRWAGLARNRDMAKYADAAIIIWDGKSRGTKNMIEEAKKNGLTVYVHTVINGVEK